MGIVVRITNSSAHVHVNRAQFITVLQIIDISAKCYHPHLTIWQHGYR